ncbi:MAG: L,D-transpeptidase [Chlorobi bacterium]|nr:L,D-transpeptidase [Chlorobiota bacterium]
MGKNKENTMAIEGNSFGSKSIIVLPLLLGVFFFVGFTQLSSRKENLSEIETYSEVKTKNPRINFSALLAAEQFSQNLRDTVYTADDFWLELRIDQQMLYVHYRDGRIVKYPVSTGNPHLSKSVESRPGLYAIFLKEEVHLSSQFNDARMNYYMPYNMGIGFHGLQGTGYYGHLGVRPSSHGCIRMRNVDVKALFHQCKIGTLVLSHKGRSARVVAFAPEGFKNEADYTKEDYMNMLAHNLSSIVEGKYFVNPPKRFIIDGTVIPRIGINVSSTDNIPKRQTLPFAIVNLEVLADKLNRRYSSFPNFEDGTKNGFAEKFLTDGKDTNSARGTADLLVTEELIKKYVHNSVGILPYFPPNR